MPCLLSVRLSSFRGFVRRSPRKRCNLRTTFHSMFPVRDCDNGSRLRCIDCHLNRPIFSIRRYRVHNIACSTPLHIGLHLIVCRHRTPRNAMGSVGRRRICVNRVPLVASGNAFIVGNARHIVISRLRHDPNIFFSSSGNGARSSNGILCGTHVVPCHNS